MLLLCHCTDPLWRKNRQNTHIFHKMKSSNSENETELLKGEEGGLCEFFFDVWDVLFEFLGGVIVAYGLLVNIASASVIIHQSNSVIENRSYFLNLAAGFAQHSYSSINDDLWFFISIEEGVEVVNNIWLTIFLCTFDLFLHIFSPNFFDLFLLNPFMWNYGPLSLLGRREELRWWDRERSLICWNVRIQILNKWHFSLQKINTGQRNKLLEEWGRLRDSGRHVVLIDQVIETHLLLNQLYD